MPNHAALYLPKALIDYNFVSGVYLESGVSSTLDDAPGWTFTRTTAGFGSNAAGDTLTSYAIDAPRVVSGRGLLIEAAATNVAPNSQNISAWETSGGSITTGIADPAGGTNAQTLTAVGASDYVYTFTALVAGAVANGVWVRRRTGTGDIRLSTPDNAGATPIAVTGSWARYSRTSATSANAFLIVVVNTPGDAVDIFGGQLETGVAPSSYIVTGAGSATRGADVATIAFTGARQATIVYGGGLIATVAVTTSLDLGASSGGAWVGSYVERVVVR